MRVELRQAGSGQPLEQLELEEVPHPGRWLELGERSFLVLQRHQWTYPDSVDRSIGVMP
jgi:hypothetical protein